MVSERRSAPVRRVPAGVLLAACSVLTVFGASGCTDAPTIPAGLSAEAKVGAQVAEANSCASCHSNDGSERVGPTWKGLWGSTVQLKGGGTAKVDDEYLRTAARKPAEQRREDARGTMPVYGTDRLSDSELDSIIAYIKELAP